MIIGVHDIALDGSWRFWRRMFFLAFPEENREEEERIHRLGLPRTRADAVRAIDAAAISYLAMLNNYYNYDRRYDYAILFRLVKDDAGRSTVGIIGTNPRVRNPAANVNFEHLERVDAAYAIEHLDACVFVPHAEVSSWSFPSPDGCPVHWQQMDRPEWLALIGGDVPAAAVPMAEAPMADVPMA